mmetsp:Transcript_22698/g.79373  ORF Transcript_22698/g.79373 Transcript_22698/m.79373 type:complete len:598 (-) Transcript_22698:236-2029(-)
MFYSNQILAKKGALGNIWLAAHWDKRLSKSQIFQTDIAKSCKGISEPVVPLALRVSGHLLLGLVRIYSRKVKYLFADCSDALVKIKMAFRPGVVNLADGADSAQQGAIALNGFASFGGLEGTMEDLGDDGALDAPVADAAKGEWAMVGTQSDKGVLMVGFDEMGEQRFGGEDAYGDEAADPAFAGASRRGGRTSMSTDGGPEVWRAGGADTTGDVSADFEMGGFGGMEDGAFGGGDDAAFGGGGARRESMLSMGGQEFGGMDVDEFGMGGDFATPNIKLADADAGEQITAADLADGTTPSGVSKPAAQKRRFHEIDSTIVLKSDTYKKWLVDRQYSTTAPHKCARLRLEEMREEDEARKRRYRGYTGGEALPPDYFVPNLRPELQKLIDSLHTGKHGIPKLSKEELADAEAADAAGAGAGAGGGAPTPGLNTTTDTDFNAGMGYEDFGGMDMGGFDDMDAAGGMAEGAGEGAIDEAALNAEEAEEGMRLSMSEKSGKSSLEAEPLADSSGPTGKWNTRTKRVLETLNASLETRESTTYKDLAGSSSRHTVAGCFFELLVLKSWDVVDVDQEDAYGDIHISKNGEKFDEAVAELTAEA